MHKKYHYIKFSSLCLITSSTCSLLSKCRHFLFTVSKQNASLFPYHLNSCKLLNHLQIPIISAMEKTESFLVWIILMQRSQLLPPSISSLLHGCWQAHWLQCSPLIQNAKHCSSIMFHILIWTIKNGCKLGTKWSACPFTLFVCPVWLVGKEHKEDWSFTQAAEIFAYGKYNRS